MTEHLNFIEKLFDTLKQTTDNNSSTVQKLVDQQNNLVGTVEKMPISEIRQELKDHVVAAHNEREEILDKVELKTDKILDKMKKVVSDVKELSGKIKFMIAVVAVAVALTGIVYFVGRFLVDTGSKKQTTTIEEKIRKEQEVEHKKLQKEIIKAIREELRKIHPEVDKLD
jgi:hypothetical protein